MVLGATRVTCTRVCSTCRMVSESFLCKTLHARHFVAEYRGRHLDLDFHLVQAVLAGEDDLIVGLGAVELQQHRLHLRGKTLTPRIISMSSLRRSTRRMRRRVRPQAHVSV